MTKEARKKDHTAKAGAVELDESELDDAAGGTETITMTYEKIQPYSKVEPGGLKITDGTSNTR